MRVNPSVSNTSVDPLRNAADSARSNAKADAVAGTSSEVASFTRSSDLSRLLATLHEQPDIREELVASVALKLANNEYATSAAAAEAATAIVDAPN